MNNNPLLCAANSQQVTANNHLLLLLSRMEDITKDMLGTKKNIEELAYMFNEANDLLRFRNSVITAADDTKHGCLPYIFL